MIDLYLFEVCITLSDLRFFVGGLDVSSSSSKEDEEDDDDENDFCGLLFCKTK